MAVLLGKGGGTPVVMGGGSVGMGGKLDCGGWLGAGGKKERWPASLPF